MGRWVLPFRLKRTQVLLPSFPLQQVPFTQNRARVLLSIPKEQIAFPSSRPSELADLVLNLAEGFCFLREKFQEVGDPLSSPREGLAEGGTAPLGPRLGPGNRDLRGGQAPLLPGAPTETKVSLHSSYDGLVILLLRLLLSYGGPPLPPGPCKR